MAYLGEGLRDLFIARDSPEGQRLRAAAIAAQLSGQAYMVLRGQVMPHSEHPRAGTRMRWAVKLDVTLDEDSFWRQYYALMRELIRRVNSG